MPNFQDVIARILASSQDPQEQQFQKWYAGHATRLGLDPNPDNPLHFYDWRSAYESGATPDVQGHWPSRFKRAGHPNLIVEGIDTRTGRPQSEGAWQRFLSERPFDPSAP